MKTICVVSSHNRHFYLCVILLYHSFLEYRNHGHAGGKHALLSSYYRMQRWFNPLRERNFHSMYGVGGNQHYEEYGSLLIFSRNTALKSHKWLGIRYADHKSPLNWLNYRSPLTCELEARLRLTIYYILPDLFS